MIERMYRKHGIGLGVFSMEGFEAKNSKSKTAIRRQSNSKGNLCTQTTLYLLKEFVFHKHNIADVSHVRSLPSFRHDFCLVTHENKKQKKDNKNLMKPDRIFEELAENEITTILTL